MGNKVLAASTESDALGHYQLKIRPNEKYILTIDQTDELKGDNSDAIASNNNPINQGIWVVHPSKPVETEQIEVQESATDNWFDSIKNSSKRIFTIYHDFDKAAYRIVDEKILQEAIQLLQDHPDYWLQIVSATDCKGSQEYNQALSERRARYVLNHLPKQLQAKAIMRCVSKNEPKEPCEQGNAYNETAQEINRYTYLLVSDSKKIVGSK